MSAPHERAVFDVGGVAYRWRDVLDAARSSGDWAATEQGAARHESCLRAMAAGGGSPPEGELKARASEFRHARNLLAADEMEAWLAHWGITVTQWLNHLRGELLARGARSVPGAPDRTPPGAAWTHAVCSGELERLASRLAERLAVSAGAGEDPPPTPLGAAAVHAMERTFERFCVAAADERSIEREVASHFLGWTRLGWRYVACPEQDAAREAALCVREDGTALEAVAGGACLALREQSALLDDADPQIAPALMGAQPGAILGPLMVGEEHWVLEVGERAPPSVNDRVVRERARRLLVERAIAREVATRVVWREPVHR